MTEFNITPEEESNDSGQEVKEKPKSSQPAPEEGSKGDSEQKSEGEAEKDSEQSESEAEKDSEQKSEGEAEKDSGQKSEGEAEKDSEQSESEAEKDSEQSESEAEKDSGQKSEGETEKDSEQGDEEKSGSGQEAEGAPLPSEKSNKDKYLKVVRIAVRTVLWVIVAFFAVIALLLAYDRFIRKSPIASIFGNSFLVIATPSMEDALSAGDIVVVKKQDSYQVGDIVTYFPQGDSVSVTHRIIRIEGDKFYLRGDANPTEDPNPVDKEQIVGKVVNVFSNGGIIIEWLKTPAGIFFLVAILGVLVALAIIG